MARVLRLSLARATIIALAACGATSATSATPQSFAITAKEFGFTPAQITVTSGTRSS